MLKFTKRPKAPGITLKKTWLFLMGISYLQVILMLFGMKYRLIWFNLQRNGTGNGLSNIGDTFAESFQLQTTILHQNLCILKAGLSSLSDAWAKYKKTYLICQIPIKIVKQHAFPNSSSQNLKIFSSTGYRKTSQKWIM